MARKRYIQERIATGRLTLPVAILLVSLMWLIGCLSPIKEADSSTIWNLLQEILQGSFVQALIGYILLGITVVQLWVLNNAFALIRVHTNFYLTLFVLFAGMLLPPTLDMASVIVPCLLLSTHNLFGTYQVQQPVGPVFQSFLFLGLGSLLFPPILYYLPFLYASLINFRALTWRTFFAGIMGIVLPYWALLAYVLFTGEMNLFYEPFQKLIPELPVDYSNWTLPRILSLGYILLITIAGGLHCVVKHYDDKIKTRALLSYVIALQVWTLLFLFLQPQHFATLFPVLIAGSSILGGHLFALSRTKGSNLFFLVCTLLFIALVLYTIWMHLHNIY